MSSGTQPDTYDDIEIGLLLEAVYEKSGFDFRDYDYTSLKRRIWKSINDEGLDTPSRLQERILRDKGSLERLLAALSVNVTSMFRDPALFLALRQQVAPALAELPFIRIWDCGCSTGEEAYSLAIVLAEEGLYDRCVIYATDMNERAVQSAKEGIFPVSQMQEYTRGYYRSGGKESFNSYFTARYDYAILSAALRKNIVFARHNLVTDASFNEFHLILSRNVMIYFNWFLQERALKLFYDSLVVGGYLGLGERETVNHSASGNRYEPVVEGVNLYRKVG